MLLSYYGHSCFYAFFEGKHLLFDPFIKGNPLAQHIDIESIKADYILISHGHGDHVGDALEIAQRTGAKIISNFEIVSWLDNQGVKGYALNQGGKYSFDFGMVKMVSACHSGTLPDGSNGGNPNGFVIWSHNHCFYFAGDTALSYDMKLIPMTCPQLDFAILPMGDVFTMGIEDACIAADFCKVKTVVAAHFDTFDPIKIDHQAAISTFLKNDIKLIVPEIGKAVNWE